jgi:hypothetical protein
MNVASGYSIASNYDGYGAEKTSSASSKPFTISTFIDEKPTGTQTSRVMGVLTRCGESDYDPFKDIAKTGNINLPEYMLTKTTPTRSDEEILKEIEELAKEHARTRQSSNDDERFQELMDEYVSSVSPDRAGILKNAVAEINGRLNSQGNSNYSMSAAFQQIDSQRTQKEKEGKEPIDYFLEALKNRGKGSSGATSTIIKNGNYHTEIIDHGDGMKTILNYAAGEFTSMNLQGNNYFVGGIDDSSSAVTYAEFFDDSNQIIMDFHGKDLKQVHTKEEVERMQEGSAVYKAAYNKACERLTSGSVA